MTTSKFLPDYSTTIKTSLDNDVFGSGVRFRKAFDKPEFGGLPEVTPVSKIFCARCKECFSTLPGLRYTSYSTCSKCDNKVRAENFGCPFAVGERIRLRSHPDNEGVVTSVSKEGFEYKMEYPTLSIPKWGLISYSGMSSPSGYHLYELAYEPEAVDIHLEIAKKIVESEGNWALTCHCDEDKVEKVVEILKKYDTKYAY